MVVVTCDFIFSLYWQIVKEREIEQLFFFFLLLSLSGALRNQPPSHTI